MRTTLERKQATTLLFANLKQSGRAIVVDFEQVVTDFWFIDKRNVHMLENWLDASKRFPRINAAARRLLPKYCGVKVSKKGDSYKVENLDLSKKQKALCLTNINGLKAMALNSLLDHKDIKVTVESTFNKETALKSYQKNVQKLVANGVSMSELVHMMQVAIDAVEKQAKDNVVSIKAA